MPRFVFKFVEEEKVEMVLIIIHLFSLFLAYLSSTLSFHSVENDN